MPEFATLALIVMAISFGGVIATLRFKNTVPSFKLEMFKSTITNGVNK